MSPTHNRRRTTKKYFGGKQVKNFSTIEIDETQTKKRMVFFNRQRALAATCSLRIKEN